MERGKVAHTVPSAETERDFLESLAAEKGALLDCLNRSGHESWSKRYRRSKSERLSRRAIRAQSYC